jgi:formyl-CoA transferase
MIDVAIIEPLFALLGAQATIYDQTGEIKGRSGNRTGNHAPRNIYKTRDDHWIAISTAAQSIAERVMTLVGHPEVITEPWFGTGEDRAGHADELDGMVAAWVAERDYVDVMRGFEEVGAAIAPIYDISQVMDDPQYKALNSVITVDDDDLGPIKMQNLLFRMSKTPGKVRHPAHRLGQDTDAVLREVLGVPDERLQELHASGVIEPRKEKQGAEA